MPNLLRLYKLRWLVVIFALLFALCACATSQAKTATPSPISSSAPAATAAASPYPTPAAWQRFTDPGFFSVDVPVGWTQSPVLENTVNLRTYYDDGSRYGHAVSLLIVMSASRTQGDIPGFCPAHPTTTLAGLPAAEKSGYDSYGRPYLEWDAANQATGLRFIVTVGLPPPTYKVSDLANFHGVYIHMLHSLAVPSQYIHTPACTS